MITSIKSNKQLINKNATYQKSSSTTKQMLKITLPTTPNTIWVNNYNEMIIPKNIILRNEPEINIFNETNLLNFIDFDKLNEQKTSKFVESYELINLKDLAKELLIPFSNVSKSMLIQKIKTKYVSVFGTNNNLIYNIKLIQPKDININIITKLFDKHEITLDTQNKLLPKIIMALKKKDEHIIKTIIKIIESEWIKPKIKK
jgi:hypothetical protein